MVEDMDKTIENKFFEAFKWGGVVDKCIDWMRHTYNLPPVRPRTKSEGDKQPKDEAAKAANKKWERYYREILPKEILEATEAFDDSVIMYMDSPLMDEIEANLNECQTDAQRERYLFSLLKPFGESPSGCGLARIYNPAAEINQLNEAIKECERDKAFWQTMPEDEQLRNVNGELSGTPKEQIGACNSMIERYREQIEWVLNVNRQFCNLTGVFGDGAKWMQKGTVESCLSAFVGVEVRFANRLDALLLTYGIDLMRLQKESGLYLKNHRLITDVCDYIGSMELAQKYIDGLPKEPQSCKETDAKSLKKEQSDPKPQQEEQPKVTNNNLPSELDTDEAHKYFAKAKEIGLIDYSYKWLKGRQLLSCFCHDMSQKLNLGKGNRIAWKPFEVLFGTGKGKLRSSYNDIQKTGRNPSDIALVDEVFK